MSETEHDLRKRLERYRRLLDRVDDARAQTALREEIEAMEYRLDDLEDGN